MKRIWLKFEAGFVRAAAFRRGVSAFFAHRLAAPRRLADDPAVFAVSISPAFAGS
jgi:hypothetical protein